MPSESGATSSSNRSCTASLLSPDRMAACTAKMKMGRYITWICKNKMPTSSVCNSLVRVDTLVEFFATEEIAQQLLYFWNTRRSTDEYNVLHLRLVEFRIAQWLFDRIHCTTKQISVEFFESRPCNVCVEIDAFEQRINFDTKKLDKLQTNIKATIHTWLDSSLIVFVLHVRMLFVDDVMHADLLPNPFCVYV